MSDSGSHGADGSPADADSTPSGGEGEGRTGDTASSPAPRADGGSVGDSDQVDYLTSEVNLFRPSTPFMRDHLRVVWTMFAAWVIVVFGPVTATYLATDLMTSVTVLGFPLHYLLTAVGAPLGALVLSVVYARKRDQLDEQYGIEHGAGQSVSDGEPTAVDGGDVE